MSKTNSTFCVIYDGSETVQYGSLASATRSARAQVRQGNVKKATVRRYANGAGRGELVKVFGGASVRYNGEERRFYAHARSAQRSARASIQNGNARLAEVMAYANGRPNVQCDYR